MISVASLSPTTPTEAETPLTPARLSSLSRVAVMTEGVTVTSPASSLDILSSSPVGATHDDSTRKQVPVCDQHDGNPACGGNHP